MLPLILPFPFLQVEESLRNQRLQFILSCVTNILQDLQQISVLLVIVSKKLKEIKLHFQIGLVVRNNH